jgi:hypothetical protein
MEIKRKTRLNKYYLFRLLNGMKLFLLIAIASVIATQFSIISLYLVFPVFAIGYFRVRRKVIYLLESISLTNGNLKVIYYYYGTRKEIIDNPHNFVIKLMNASEGKTKLFQLNIKYKTENIELYDLIIWGKDSFTVIENEWRSSTSKGINQP